MIMNIIARIQTGLLFTAAKFIKVPVPETWTGAGSRGRIGSWCRSRGCRMALVITDKPVMKLGIAKKMFDSLKKEGIGWAVYDGVLPNPTVGMAREAVALGKAQGADAVIAVGGGSVMDCAKLVAAAMTSGKDPKKHVGKFRVWTKPLPLAAVPTTAGTGSEVSVGAVISDDVTHWKGLMITPAIVPRLAVLDGETMTGLPPHLTASTAFDALTHAVEAYIARNDDAVAERDAREAVSLINTHLMTAFKKGKDIKARDAMALAACKAALAFNRNSLGYCHAFGHRLTGFYDLPHGLAVGMFLPHVLEFSLDRVEGKLAKLAVACGLGSASEAAGALARKFVKRVFELYAAVKLPPKCDALKRSDYPQIIKEAFKEANATYAVPKYMSRRNAEALLDRIIAG